MRVTVFNHGTTKGYIVVIIEHGDEQVRSVRAPHAQGNRVLAQQIFDSIMGPMTPYAARTCYHSLDGQTVEQLEV